MSLRVLSAASEAVPLIKTGGLADVAGALPAAVAPYDVAMTTLLPGYPAVMSAVGPKSKVIHKYDSLLGTKARLIKCTMGGYPLIVLDAPDLFQRDGGPYSDLSGKDWPDNALRFAAFARAAADLAAGAIKGERFDLLHAHDWQAAMAAAYMRFAPPPKTQPIASVVTIHNIAFQGVFDASMFKQLGLPATAFAIDGVEYHGNVSFLKGGLEATSMITTVSPSYAAEIRNPAFGMGMEGLITSRGSRVRGILNGIDPAEWNPATDPHIVSNYSWRILSRRTPNKRAIEKIFGLERSDGPLFIVVSRLTWQKGIDLLIGAIDHLVGLGGRLAVLGAGDGAMEEALRKAAQQRPGKVGVHIGYDEALSHQMQAGGDAILIPSRFEPCGLTQLYGLAYGCVPIVSRTGGLGDTVINANVAALGADAATGIMLSAIDQDGVSGAITRAIGLFEDRKGWKAMQINGMKANFSWAASGQAYADLYRQLVMETAA